MKPPPTSDLIVQLVTEWPDDYELFHTRGADGEAFVTILRDDRAETLRVQSMRFRRHLEQRFYVQHGPRVPNGQAMQDALGVLAGRALFAGDAHNVACRIGAAADGWYLDLGTDDWRAVAIKPGAWAIVDRPDVRFRRERGMEALPTPIRGGSIDALRAFMNVATDEDFALVVAWLLAALRPRGPYAVLVIHGEHGSCKSTLARILRRLVDPNEAALRSAPSNEQDIAIAARNGWMINFDNLSRLPERLSDALCRVATGGGFATRQLYSDADEVVINYMRPIVINGIEELATRPDLLDRALIVTLPTVPAERRQTEETFWASFEAAAPSILGALLDILVRAEQQLHDVHLKQLPRMADFARFGVAVERALGWKSGTFLKAYMGNRGNAHALTLEANPLAPLIMDFMRNHPEWSGPVRDLLDALKKANPDANPKIWPATPTVLSGQLRRLAPSLRSVGVSVGFDEKARPRRVNLHLSAPEEQVESTSEATGASGNGTGRRSDAPDADSPTLSGSPWVGVR